MDAASKTEEAAVRQRLDSWIAAFLAKDTDAIMAHYATDVVAYDAIQQLQFKGKEAYRKHWEACMQMCQGPGMFEVKEAATHAVQDLAVVHALVYCGGTDDAGQTQGAWMRMTTTYRQIGGEWLIVHEHFSAPFDMQTGKALFDIAPDNQQKTRTIPLGMSAVTPHLVCDGASDAIAFYQKAFGAQEESRMDMPDGKIGHASIRIGGAAIMLVDEFPQWGSFGPKTLKGTPVTVHLYVQDADAAMKKAVAAGAKEIMAVQEMFWGDRYGVLEDPYGHRWAVATHVRDLTPEQIKEGAIQMMQAQPGCMDQQKAQ